MKAPLGLLLFISLPVTALSQNDTLVFNNGDRIVGEIKSMSRGVVVISTDYDDSNFRIDWDEVGEIYTETYFFVSVASRKSYYGWIRTKSPMTVTIISRDSVGIECRKSDIVYLMPINLAFKDRFSAEIDVGVSAAKSMNLRRLTIGLLVGYKTESWTSYVTYNTLLSRQDETDPIRRTDADFVFQYILYEDWYLTPSVNYLANTEQNLNYRWNTQIGVGNYIFRSNEAYLGITLGINRNTEGYTNDTPKAESWEGTIGAELNLFDFGDLDLLAKIMAYPGITEKGRWRVDSSMNLKYDLPLDFYVRLGGSLNYDNQPGLDGSETDYVIQTGVGWEW